MQTGQLNATYNSTNKTLAGSVNSGGDGSIAFSGGPMPGSLYNYNVPASLSTIAGAWSVTGTYGSSFSLSISSSGALTVQSGPCVASGTVSPRASGKNVYNLTATFGSTGCNFPGMTRNRHCCRISAEHRSDTVHRGGNQCRTHGRHRRVRHSLTVRFVSSQKSKKDNLSLGMTNGRVLAARDCQPKMPAAYDRRYYAILGMDIGGIGRTGVVKFSVQLAQELRPMIRDAIKAGSRTPGP